MILPRLIVCVVVLAVVIIVAFLIHTYRADMKSIRRMQENIKETYSPCAYCKACGKCKRKEVTDDGRKQDAD